MRCTITWHEFLIVEHFVHERWHLRLAGSVRTRLLRLRRWNGLSTGETCYFVERSRSLSNSFILDLSWWSHFWSGGTEMRPTRNCVMWVSARRWKLNFSGNLHIHFRDYRSFYNHNYDYGPNYDHSTFHLSSRWQFRHSRPMFWNLLPVQWRVCLRRCRKQFF